VDGPDSRGGARSGDHIDFNAGADRRNRAVFRGIGDFD